MRNLKRALSLALASVMLLGMMVVGTSAASYPDVDEKDNVEAIEVLNAVNVMIGRQGNFEPDEAVNRHEMAVIMAKLVLGVDTADNYVGTHPFTDVVPWADKYVAACYENGLVAGTSATTYGGGAPLTAVQAAAMMLRALGYKDLNKGYQGDWRAPITAMANQIRLFSGVASNPNEQLNRNQVAQLALNTLKSPMVNLKDNTISWTDGDGQIIISGGSRDYIVLSSREAYARAINDVESQGTSASAIGGWTVELGEHLYNGKLKLTSTTDDFKRPVRQWEYDGKEIGSYIKEELLEYSHVGEVTGKDLYEVLGKTAIDEYTMIVALDGVTDPDIVYQVRGLDGKTELGAKHNQHFVFDASDLNRSNKGSVGATGTGVLTQVFVDPNYDNGGSAKDGRIWISVINTYLARATQDYDSRREELTLNAYSVTENRDEYVALDKDGTAPVTIRLGVEEYPVVKDADKNDAFLVTFAEGEVQTIVPAEVMEAVTISSFKKNSNVVVDGTKYNFTTTAGFDAKTLKAYTGDAVTNLKDSTYNVFLDAYGNTIGVQEVDAKKNYVFLAAIDINDSNLVNGTADAKAVFLDGTVDTIRVNVDKSDLDYYTKNAEPGGYNKNSILNTWCTYTKNNSDVYTVKQVVDINAKGDTFVPGYKVGDKVNNNTGLAQYHQTGFTAANEKIDKKHITLQGNTTNTGSYARVYGNEKTVYLNAELTNLTNQGGIWGVVKDVDSVTTGAENVNLTVWTDKVAQEAAETTTIKLTGKDYATKGVYTLYDDDGIVIAAVVAGEDDGSARNLVYVHSGSIDSETYNGSSSSRAAGDGMWTWTRKVIRNGEEVTLTEVSDGNSELDLMKQYHWYQIKTNADGEVTGVYELPDDDLTKLKEANLTRYKDYALTYKNGGDKTGNIGEIAYTVQKGASTVLYWNQDYIKSRLLMNGRTLYVATDDQTGFIVNSNVKWVVQQWDNNKKETYIDDGTTAAGLKSMIDEINRRNTKDEVEYNYTYQVSAVIESGIASSVVIYFNENDYNRPDRPVTGNATMDFNKVSGVWTLKVPKTQAEADALKITEIRDYLWDAGCTEIKNNGTLWSFVWEDIPAEKVELKIVGTKTTPDTYTVTVNYGANGTASANVERAEAGDKVTVTAKPADGYKTSSIEVDGTALTVTNDKATFKMPGKAVTVTVTFVKDETPDVPGGGHWEFVDGELTWIPGTSVASSMFKFARAATREGSESGFENYVGKYVRIEMAGIGLDNERYTVLVREKTLSNGTKTIALKFGDDMTKDRVDELLKAMNDSGLGLAAFKPQYKSDATSDQIADWKGDTPAPVDGITAKVELQANSTLKAAFMEYRADGTPVEKLTAAQIAAALNNSETGKEKKWAFTAADIDLTSATKAVKGHADIDINTDLVSASGKNANEATQVYKVTYPGPNGTVTAYVDATNGVKAGAAVAEGVVALLDKNTVTGAASTTVTSGKTVGALTPATETATGKASNKDTDFVAAVRLPAVAGSTASGLLATTGVLQYYTGSAAEAVLTANYIGADGRYTPISAGTDAIQVGTKIYLTTANDTDDYANQGIKVAVNGKDVLTVNVDKEGKIPTGANAPYFEIPAKETAGNTITIAPTPAPAEAKIYVGDDLLTEEEKFGTGDGTYYAISGMTNYYLAWKNADGDWVGAATGFTAADGTGIAKQTIAGLASDGITADEKGEIHLVRAWQVTGTGTTPAWTAYSTWAPTDKVNPSKPIGNASTYAHYPVSEGGTIWVQAENEGEILAAKDGSALTSVVPVTGVQTGVNGAVKGVWSVPVTGNIADGSFINLVDIGANTDRVIAIEASLTTTAATSWLEVGGVELDKTYGKNVTVTSEWAPKGGATAKLTLEAQKTGVDSGNTKMVHQVKFTSDTAVTYRSSGGTKDVLGTLTLTITAPGNDPIKVLVEVSIMK